MRHLRGPLIAGIFLALAFASSSPVNGAAAEAGFTFALEQGSAAAGETVKLDVSAQSAAAGAAGFRLCVSYDGNVLRFLGTETSGPANNGSLRTNSASNPIYSVYVCSVGGGDAPALSGRIATFLFQVKDGAEGGATRISARADQVCDFSGSPIDAGCAGSALLNVTSPSGEALLTGLVPSQGTLEPAFSPETSDYSLSVGSTVSSISFEADAVAGGTVKINRKSLSAAGSDTQIVATVTSADKNVQRQYFVLVRRAAKTASSSRPGYRAAGSISLPQERRNTAKHGGTTSVSDSAGPPASSAAQSAGALQAAGAASSAPAAPAPNLPAGISVVQNRMPAYTAGMMACAFCMLAGAAMHVWLLAKPKQ